MTTTTFPCRSIHQEHVRTDLTVRSVCRIPSSLYEALPKQDHGLLRWMALGKACDEPGSGHIGLTQLTKTLIGLGFARSTISGALGRLAKAGWIERGHVVGGHEHVFFLSWSNIMKSSGVKRSYRDLTIATELLARQDFRQALYAAHMVAFDDVPLSRKHRQDATKLGAKTQRKAEQRHAAVTYNVRDYGADEEVPGATEDPAIRSHWDDFKRRRVWREILPVSTVIINDRIGVTYRKRTAALEATRARVDARRGYYRFAESFETAITMAKRSTKTKSTRTVLVLEGTRTINGTRIERHWRAVV